MNLFDLTGKVAVVTGAGGWLGSAMSKALYDAGAHVILCGRSESIYTLAGDIERLHPLQLDLSNEVEVREELSELPPIDILVNNAYEFSEATGFNTPTGTLEEESKVQWMSAMESGVYWAALCTQILSEGMKTKGGSIINISSMYAIVAPDPALYEGVDTWNPPSYGAGKAALLSLTRYTASFYGKYDIRCNSICPGPFPNTSGGTYNSPPEELLQRLSNRTVLGRYGCPEELGGPVVFLGSDASSYMTGATLVIDGGWVIR